ncbi:hypothetical protein Gotur_005115, partial [Gossypium turneri]
IAAVPEDIGTAGALRANSHHLTAKDILVVSGDLVSDVPPGALAATHRRHDAAVTTMLCSTPMEMRSDLKDAHMYAFKRSVLQEVLDVKDTFQSSKEDVLPYLVRSQLKSEALLNRTPQGEENSNEKVSSQNNQAFISRILANASTPSFHGLYSENPDGSFSTRKTHKCCVYIASSSSCCVRLNSIQAFMDINRDVTGDADHLLSPNNIIGPSPKLGTKTTVGPNCRLGEGSEMGDKCQVKRSIIGRHCRIGSHVKVVNSVVMNHVTIGDGCIIQGSVICSNVQLQERVVLKDCQVINSPTLLHKLCIH